MAMQQKRGGDETGVDMAKVSSSGYPLPELMAYLKTMEEEDQEYKVLSQLLSMCAATVENANKLWCKGGYNEEEALETTFQAVQYGFQSLIPLILRNVVGGWRELLLYLNDPETCPWYDPLVDWSSLPLLQECQPDKSDYEEAPTNDRQEIRVQVG